MNLFVQYPSRFISIAGAHSMANDPYVILGVDRSASKSEVKKQYFKLAKKYHPDLNPDDEVAQRMFMSVQAAYREIECDLDPSLRDRRR
mmetsp:Transcript_20027/g.14515  ORF Transcript_20027/g.14515 Transcript_20027/m.14515 type:complete len:89 (+) Transcript_20027:92-358(+)